MLRETALFLFAMVLIYMTTNKRISITLSAIIFISGLLLSQYDNIYRSFIFAKEREAFERRMENIVQQVNQNESTPIPNFYFL